MKSELVSSRRTISALFCDIPAGNAGERKVNKGWKKSGDRVLDLALWRASWTGRLCQNDNARGASA